MNGSVSVPVCMRCVRQVRSRIFGWSVAGNLVVWLSILVAGAALLIFLDSVFRFAAGTRWGLLVAWVFVGAVATRRILTPAFAMPGIRSVMLRLERCYPELRGRLVTAMELVDQGNRERSGASSDLYRQVALAAERMAGSLDPKVAVPARPYLKRGSVGVLLLIGAVLGLSPMGGNLWVGIQRLFAPWSSAEWPYRTQIVLRSEGPFSVRRGGALTLEGSASGDVPSSGTILVWTGDTSGTPHRARFLLDDRGRFEVRYQPVIADIRAQLAVGDAKTRTVDVTMVPPPEVESVDLFLEYPAYSRLPAVTLPDGNVQALFGTQAKLTVRASKPLSKAYLSWYDGTGLPLELTGPSEGTTIFAIRRNDAYHVDLVDTLGFESDPSVTYRVEMIDNEYPRITSMDPGADKEVTPEAEVPLELDTADDFALAGASLSYRVGEAATETVALPLTPGVKRTTIEYLWKIEELGVEPGERIEYWVEVRDEGEHFAEQPFPTSRHLRLQIVDSATLRRRLNDRSEQLLSRLVELAQLQSESADAVSDVAEDVDAATNLDDSMQEIRSEEWKQERIRRQTAQIGELLIDLAKDFEISKVGRVKDVRRIRKAGDTLRHLAAEPMPQVVLRLRQSVDLLGDVSLDRRNTELELSPK
jgi:hypothetical protein